ncbi:MAG TPA: GTPase ObgE, partial [bacterium]|nr:GTPase ObgE [bacterium]
SGRAGRSAEDRFISVPVGTVVLDDASGERLADLVAPGQRFVAARGGRGGRGNAHFATPTHRAPREAEPGGTGESRWLRLELQLLADVGLVGLPNAGKSSLLARISAARPKVADYPFTTTEPMLGVVPLPDAPGIVVADIPGLIEGAHRGVGLGHKFLRHIERTRVLVHVVDLAGDDPPLQLDTVERELARHSTPLADRPTIVAGNKIDLPEARARWTAFAAFLARRGQTGVPISAATGDGIPALLQAITAVLRAHPRPAPEEALGGGEKSAVPPLAGRRESGGGRE